jgi:D-alanine-D-alanine ligase
MKIVVLAGGFSAERNVSFSSSALVCKALRELGHQAIMADAYLGISTEHPEALFETLPPLSLEQIKEQEPDLPAVRALRADGGRNFFGPHILELCQCADLVFIGLHGQCGEDGKLQAAFDLMGIPYTGSGFLGSALAMDKDLAKQLAAEAGVNTPKWKVLSYTVQDIPDLAESLSVPCAIKVHNGGSSIGVFLPKTKAELKEALHNVLEYGDKIIWEQFVEGREFSVGVLGDRSLPPIEIIPKTGFYDYKNKYQPGATLEICPADLTEEEDRKLREQALLVHQTLGLSVYSRGEFILDQNGKTWFLEVNTLPGMTPTSLLPQEAAAIGISYHELCKQIIESSMKLRGM